MMALKDIWKDLVDGVSEIDADDINNIAGAFIDIENEGVSTDLSNYYTKQEVEQKIDEVSDIADEAIEIAQSVRADADNGVFNGKDGADYIITEADKEEIKADVVETLTRSSVALPEMLDVNTIYDLGEQDALTLNLPSGKLGDFIEVDFLSTQTPTTLTITASAGMSDYELIPDANTIYSLYFNWIRLDAETYGWGFGYAEYTRTVKV